MANIDTIFGDDQDTSTDSEKLAVAKTFSKRLLVRHESTTSTHRIDKAAQFITKTFTGFSFPRIVYCTLSEIELVLTQTADGVGTGYLRLTQDCNSRRGDGVPLDADWEFSVKLFDHAGALLRWEVLGWWNHDCGRHVVELRDQILWAPGSINPILLTDNVLLIWHHYQEVASC